jgi:hypothetical protein
LKGISLIKKIMTKFFLAFLLVIISACTSKPDLRMPPADVLLYPYSMAQNGPVLAIASTSAGQKYHWGRLVTINTGALQKMIDAGQKNIEYKKLINTNVLIPQDAGDISFSKFLTLASRENNQLINLDDNAIANCNKPDVEAKDCPHVQTLNLRDNDPFSLKAIRSLFNQEFLLVTYLTSDLVDVVDIRPDSMKIHKSFNAYDLLAKKMDQKKIKNYRAICRKTAVSFKNDPSKARAYFLFEQHPKKTTTLSRVKASFLLSIKVDDLLHAATITDSMVDIWNLSESFAMAAGVQDLFVDDNNNQIYILARDNLLYKIDLPEKKLIRTAPVCMGASSMAVSTAKNMMVVPCFKDNQIAQYSLSSFSLQNTSPIYGRGPGYVVIDETRNLIYCTYFLGGFVAVLDDRLDLKAVIR